MKNNIVRLTERSISMKNNKVRLTKRSINKTFIIVTILMLLMVLCYSCNDVKKSNKAVELEHYRIQKIDGNWSLVFNDERNANTDNGMLSTSADLTFDSIEELVSKIKTDSFTDGEIKKMHVFLGENENEFALFDLENPITAVCPDGYSVGKVYWYGESYSFIINGQNGNTIRLRWYSDDGFQSFYQSQYVNYTEDDNFDFSEPEYVDGKVIYTVTSNTSIRKMVRYEPLQGVFIEELYLLGRIGNSSDSRPLSEDIPYRIRLYNSSSDIKYTVFITHPTKSFSIEELLSFRLTNKK